MTAPPDSPCVWLRPLGGVGRFGRNCLVVEVEGGPALIVDCGVRFLDDGEAPGFDLGLPDLEAVAALGDRLLAYVITHGHEDHIGALPFAFERAPATIYATRFTRALIERRFRRTGHAVPAVELLHPGVVTAVGPFTLRPVAVSHSVPDTVAVAIDTPAGRIVHSADFRVDEDPLLGPPTDLEALRQLGDEGVRCLVADSTGALTKGRNPGERSVVDPLTRVLENAPGRVLFSTYASHVQRVAAIAEACRRTGRRLAVVGRGIKENLHHARVLGLFGGDDVMIAESDIGSVPPSRLALVCPGCQGEPRSTLMRIAEGQHRAVRLAGGDTVVLTSRTIPGNEKAVAALLDLFARAGVATLGGQEGRHVSGHGYREDLELLLAALRPETFVAAHGGHRMLAAHREIATSLGLGSDSLIPLEDGARVGLVPGGVKVAPVDEAIGEPMVEAGLVVGSPRPVVAARRRMRDGGVLIIDEDGGRIVGRALSARLSDARAAELFAFIRARLKDGVRGEHLIDKIANRIAADDIAVPEIVLLNSSEGGNSDLE